MWSLQFLYWLKIFQLSYKFLLQFLLKHFYLSDCLRKTLKLVANLALLMFYFLQCFERLQSGFEISKNHFFILFKIFDSILIFYLSQTLKNRFPHQNWWSQVFLNRHHLLPKILLWLLSIFPISKTLHLLYLLNPHWNLFLACL